MQPIIYATNMIQDVSGLPCNRIYIYTLNDDTGVRYVGQTNNPSIRLSSHMCNARNNRDKTPRGLWIAELCKNKIEPIMVIIEQCKAGESNRRERYWIDYYRKKSVNLLNGSRWGGNRPGAGRKPKAPE